jgi:hypothetical protein
MRLSWGPGSGSSGGSLQRSRRSDAALLLTAVLTMSLLVAGCNLQQEQTQHGYTVYNDSSGTYVVRMSYANGTGYALLAPPQTSVHEYGGSDPVKALVFDATCSTRLEGCRLPLRRVLEAPCTCLRSARDRLRRPATDGLRRRGFRAFAPASVNSQKSVRRLLTELVT